MRFSKNFPDELRLQISVSEVVSKKVSLKKHGKEYTGLCPFHNEKSPSFSVNDQKGFYHCFGCGAHGDIITFVMQNEGLDFKDAIIKLANDNGITIPIIKNDHADNFAEVDRDYLLLETACKFFENNLYGYSGSPALAYLQGRGLNQKNIKKFRLGFAENSFDSLINHLKKSDFTEQELLNSGIISKSENQKLYDKFRGRIIFPITGKNGKVIAFGGRSLGDEMPKYLNSAETKLFKKGQNLYNYSSAKKSIYDQKFVVIVEGYMDVISLDVNEISNVVAPLGTAITSDQLKELFKITEDVVICLDGDEAGIKAMQRAIDTALPIITAENIIRFAFLPNKMDPDDFVKLNGKNSLQNLFLNAKNLSEVLLNFEAKNLNLNLDEKNISPEKKSQLEKKLVTKINLISDANIKKYFLQYYKNFLFEIGKNKFLNNKNISTKNKIDLSLDTDLSSLYAINIIQMIICHPQLIHYQDEYYNIADLHFENEELTNLKEEIFDFINHQKNYDLEEIKNHIKKYLSDNKIKNKILLDNKILYDLDMAKIRLQILILKYHHHQVCDQYRKILTQIDEVETDEVSIKNGRQKEIFDHKTFLEKKIQKLENEII